MKSFPARIKKLQHRLQLEFIPSYLRDESANIGRYLIYGYLIRIFFMPLLVQSDLIDNYFGANFLYKYHHLIPAGFPYLALFLFSFWLRVISPLMPDFIYAHTRSPTLYISQGLEYQYEVSDPNLFFFLILTKLPYFFFDLISGLLLMRIVKNPVQSLWSFKLWMLSPISIFISYVVGQYDIITVSLVLLCVFLFGKGRLYLSGLALGLGIAFEYFPIVILPLMVYLGLQNFTRARQKIRFVLYSVLLGLLPTILSFTAALTFPTLSSPVFSGYSSVTQSAVSTVFSRALDLTVSLVTAPGFVDKIYLTPIIFLFTMFYTWSSRGDSFSRLINSMAVLFGLFFAFTGFLVQWFLWIVPFLIIFVVAKRFPLWLYVLINAAYFVYIWNWGNYITTYLFLPITSQAFYWPNPVLLLNWLGAPGFEFVNAFRSLLSGALILFVVRVIRPSFLSKDVSPEVSVSAKPFEKSV